MSAKTFIIMILTWACMFYCFVLRERSMRWRHQAHSAAHVYGFLGLALALAFIVEIMYL